LHDEKKKVRLIASLLFALLILLLVIARQTTLDRDHLTGVERGVRDLLAPLQSGATVVYNGLRVIPDYFTGIDRLEDEKAGLETQLEELQNKYNTLLEEQAENKRLRALLNISDQYSTEWEPVVTRVTGRNANTWYETITIRGGENMGFVKDMPVINGDGLVGRILNVSKYSSEVLLLLDNNASAACLTQVSRTPGVVEASPDESSLLQLIHIPYDSPIEKYETVLTSGLGGIYPKGLRVGFITDIQQEPGGLMLTATIQPFVDFDRLEEVLVLLPKASGGGALD